MVGSQLTASVLLCPHLQTAFGKVDRNWPTDLCFVVFVLELVELGLDGLLVALHPGGLTERLVHLRLQQVHVADGLLSFRLKLRA